MTGLGLMLHVLLIWAWVWPESFGRWIGTIIKAAKSVLTPLHLQEER